MNRLVQLADIHKTDQANPAVWVLSGYKAGDTTQMLALANALGWEYEVKELSYRFTELLSNRLLGVTLAGIKSMQSSSLHPPWPDLVITAGRRNEPVARWIKAQSSGTTRLVHLGRPWAPIHCFDLVISTPQYFLPAVGNVMEIDLPLHGITPEKLALLKQSWSLVFEKLSRPFWTVLLGGDSGPFVFTCDKARWLAKWLNERVSSESGSVLVTNSARTPKESYHAFLSELRITAHVHHWGSPNVKNPYQGYLANADKLVVTGESMSMLSESAATDKPLYVYDLSDCPRHEGEPSAGCKPWWRFAHNFRYKPMSHRLAMQFAPRRMKRDIAKIQQRLVDTGRAVWVGEEWSHVEIKSATSDCERAAERVKKLLNK